MAPYVVATRDWDPLVRRQALALLRRFTAARVYLIADFAASVFDRDTRVAVEAISALGSFGKAARPALESLRKAAQSRDKAVREAAAQAIKKIE